MKRFVLIGLLMLLVGRLAAQTSLCLSTDKTTSLIFPFTIKHVDRGTAAVLAQQVKEMPNLLLVKAGTKGFTETNLSVVTEDGSVYGFAVCYDGNPLTLIYKLPVQSAGSIERYAEAILDNPKVAKGIKTKRWDVSLGIEGIYVKGETMFFQLRLKNESPIEYDVDLLRFFIADLRKSKRTAVQELDMQPLHTAGSMAKVKAFTASVIVVALPKFTIPDAKYFGIQLKEKAGGRHLSLKVTNRRLMQAILLPDQR